MQAAWPSLRPISPNCRTMAPKLPAKCYFTSNTSRCRWCRRCWPKRRLLKTKQAVNLQVLGVIVYEDARLSFNNMLRGEKAREKRDAVLEDVRRFTERLRFSGNAPIIPLQRKR